MLVVGLGLMLVACCRFFSHPKSGGEGCARGLGRAGCAGPGQLPCAGGFPEWPERQPGFFDDYAGQVILYNAWATWCPPCKAEMPTLQAYYEKHRDQGFVIIAIEDGLQAMSDVEKFVPSMG
jgi:thiol-disulfide isomerase/thioredoxin